MNLSEWSYSLYPYPCNATFMLNTSLGTSFNSSSGYESTSNDSSLIEPYFSNPLSIAEVREGATCNSLIF